MINSKFLLPFLTKKPTQVKSNQTNLTEAVNWDLYSIDNVSGNDNATD